MPRLRQPTTPPCSPSLSAVGRRAACLLLSLAVLAGGTPAQTGVDFASAPPVQWFQLRLIASGLAVLIPADWEQDEGSWQYGDDRRFMVGWLPEAPGDPAQIVDGMKQHVESNNPASALLVEAVPGDAAEPLGMDLVGTHTDAEGLEHWQWTRVLQRADDSIVLISAQGDFADAERIARTREQLALVFSSLLNAARPEGDESDFSAETSNDVLGLGQLGPWALIELMWASPQIKADLVLSVGWAEGETSEQKLADRLLADARAATQLEVGVEARPGDDSFGLVYRVVGHEPVEEDKSLYALRNERVRWTRCSFAPGTDGLWVLKAAADLRVTHADEFLENVLTGLAPVFDAWSVTPAGAPGAAR